MKSKIFIGSSTEALKIAYAIQENLEYDALCTVWTQGIFQLSGNALDNLLNAIHKYDFAIFVFQPDDISQIHDKNVHTVRDNVIFELGMFISALGKEKVFFLIPKNSEEIHLPTDLIGMEPGHYTPPEHEEDLLAAIGSFCGKVRRQINNISKKEDQESKVSNVSSENAEEEPCKPVSKQVESTEQTKKVEEGVCVDDFDNYTISIAPTVFFANRFCSAFPGIRGVHWFNDGKQALDRLLLLLKEPIYFEKAIGYGTTHDPVWWWRAGSCLQIRVFRRLSDTRCLMDFDELEINKIAVCHSSSYHHSFVYVEVSPDNPIGLYPMDKENFLHQKELHGYAWEEYGIFEGIPITRACFDDGAAVIDGTVVDTSGAEPRVRYLSTYNFLIASKWSPINSMKCDNLSKPLLTKMLSGQDCLVELCNIVESLPRHENDG